MNARDEEIEAIAQALKERHMSDDLPALWDAMQESGEAVSGRELALLLQSERSKVAKAIVLFNLIQERIEKAAEARAVEEAEPAYLALHQKPSGTVRGKARENAEDLG